jgi:hypothetical protein
MDELQPRDPLRRVNDNQRELFRRLSQACEGFSLAEVDGAAANLIVNAIRQLHPTRDGAEKAFNELFGKTKQMLMDHYDITGRKKGVFPFDQVVSVPHFDFRDKAKFNGGGK